MEGGARVSGDAILSALLSKPTRATRSSILVASSAIGEERWPADHGTEVPDRELPKRLKTESKSSKTAPKIVVIGRLSPTLLRALRASPPPLIVVTGEADPEDVASLDDGDRVRALGPHAVVRLGDGDTVACATGADELTGLCRSLGPDAIRLALAPTPGWLWQWLSERPLASRPVAGYVDASVLSVPWVSWARKRTAPTVLVPLGLLPPVLSEPGHAGLSAAVAAHALERHTGPVFPSPRVLAAVLAGLRHGGLPPQSAEAEPDDATSQARAIWTQARRALPMTGAVIGMDRPRIDPGEAPTAAFLAQRALFRAGRAQALQDDADLPPLPVDDDGVARADELLAAAGQVLTDHESKVVVRGFSIEVTRQAVASSASGATGFADRIGYPVVLKALSPDLRRRSDIGAVELALPTGAAVRRAYAKIVDNVEKQAPSARLDGVLVAEMVPPGLDVHCGVIRLPGDDGLAIFGRTIEASAPIEPAMALLPLDAAEATLLAHAILTRLPVPGLRRAEDPDVHDLARLLLLLSDVAEHNAARIEAIDLSPVRLVTEPRRTVVIDASIRQRPHLEGR